VRVTIQPSKASMVHAPVHTIAKLEATVPMAQAREADFKKLVDEGYRSSHATQSKAKASFKADSRTARPRPVPVLMGPSGCGKSTLAKLMQGFYWPQEGQITLDGRDIRQLAANELRATFGVVPQEAVLFSGTIYDNLAMAHPHASFQDVIAACKAAEIHEVIERLPQGYQTEIGKRGTGLSGGQRQRVAIARALLKRPKVLIFDEAISKLDQQTAELFAQTINRIKGKVTMVFITHQVPKGLQVDEVVNMGQHAMQMSLVKEEV